MKSDWFGSEDYRSVSSNLGREEGGAGWAWAGAGGSSIGSSICKVAVTWLEGHGFVSTRSTTKI